MSALELDISALFVMAVILIWFMIAYQFLLTVFGYAHVVRSLRERREIESESVDYPSCAVLIPAHNEEKVIARTLEAMLRLEYPPDRLTITVVDDGSEDRTGAIVAGFAVRHPAVRLLKVPADEGGRGKSRALNVALRGVTAELVAVYDADNTPEPDALRLLTASLVRDHRLGAVLGKFRTVNKDVNLLTRFINIETLAFQSMLQAGRWMMHRVATLPGTNFVIRTEILRALDGWDEAALTEDSELSVRVYELGYRIKYVPYAVTHEQEPQEWGVFLRQRTRWVRGNNYVLGKFLREIPRFTNRRLAFDLLYTLSLYYVFFFAILISDVVFLLGVAGLVQIALPGPYTLVWVMAFVLFLLETFLTLSYDGEDSLRNLLLLPLMYFTYCQLWVVTVIRAMWRDFVRKEGAVWDKTVRFEVEPTEAAR